MVLEQQLGWQEMDRQQEEIQKSFEALEAKSVKSTRASAAGAVTVHIWSSPWFWIFIECLMMVDDVSRFWEIKSVWETRWDRWGSVDKLWLKLTTSQERQSRRQLPNPRRARSTRQDSHGFDVNFTNGEGEMNKFVSRPSQPLSPPLSPQFWKIWRADTLQITSRCQAKSLSTNRAQRGRAIGSWGQNHNQLYAIALAEGSVSKKCFWWTDKIAQAWIHVTSWCWWPASFSYAVYIYVFVNPEMCQAREQQQGC